MAFVQCVSTLGLKHPQLSSGRTGIEVMPVTVTTTVTVGKLRTGRSVMIETYSAVSSVIMSNEFSINDSLDNINDLWPCFLAILRPSGAGAGFGGHHPNQQQGGRRKLLKRGISPRVVSTTCSSGRDALATTKQGVSGGMPASISCRASSASCPPGM